jgi:hypothetical protein
MKGRIVEPNSRVDSIDTTVAAHLCILRSTSFIIAAYDYEKELKNKSIFYYKNQILIRTVVIKKLICFLKYIQLSAVFHRRVNTLIHTIPMSSSASEFGQVNPKLATLMRVIEDNQDKMTEGEYLEAMNALCALHRDSLNPLLTQLAAVEEHNRVQPQPSQPFSLFAEQPEIAPGMSQGEKVAWMRVTKCHPDPHCNRITSQAWLDTEYRVRYRMLREATEHLIAKREELLTNPEPSTCSFIARHAVGHWSMATDDDLWVCVCGYSGKTKHWKKHAESERHQNWATHRTVSRRQVEKMKCYIRDDEAGNLVRFAPYPGYASSYASYPGGIRFYTVTQEKNEWTHPELYVGIHTQPIPTQDRTERWFVYRRNTHAREYVQ